MLNIVMNVILLGLIGVCCMSFASKMEIIKNSVEKDQHKKNMMLHRDISMLSANIQELENLLHEHRKDESIHVKQYDACDCDEDEEDDEEDGASVYDIKTPTGESISFIGNVVVEDGIRYMIVDKTGQKFPIHENTKE